MYVRCILYISELYHLTTTIIYHVERVLLGSKLDYWKRNNFILFRNGNNTHV